MGTTTKTVSYRYDANRNRTLMIDPEGGRTSYSYDVLNRVTQIINPQGERTTFAYDAKGRKTVKKLANGTRASFTYDAANRLTTLANLKSDNSVISKFDYKYDNVGNRTEVAEADGSRVTFSYDNTYQLTGEHRTGTTPYRNTFTYDPVGNRLVKNENNARTTYVYDAANQLKTSVDAQGTTTYTFDNDGNQKLVQAPTGARTTTTWDYENKTTLVQLPSGIRNTMAYEPDGLRVKLEESSGTKKFTWDDQNYLAESDENNDVNVLYNNELNYYGHLISQHRKSGAVWTPSFYHYEALGSTRQLTDDTEAVTDQYLYDAWGNVITSSGTTANPFQFTGNVGYYFDVDTENQYIRARIYSPTIGRWLSMDSLGFVDGVNLYLAYFVPFDIDPSGLQNQQGKSILVTTTDVQEPNKCSGTAKVSWLFELSQKAPCNGFFIQKVTISARAKNCNAANPAQDKFSYYEAWPVKINQTVSYYQKDKNTTDTAEWPVLGCSLGRYDQNGEIAFYCNIEVGVNPRISSEHIPGWAPAGFAGRPGQAYYPNANSPFRTTSGNLTSTNDPSKVPRRPSQAGFGSAKRKFSLKWYCCPKEKPCCGAGVVKKPELTYEPEMEKEQ